jgi:putative phosphoribosyl transferase
MFKNRLEAGEKLAQKLKIELPEEVFKSAVYLMIPKGGIVVGSEIKKLLGIQLDYLITKKIPAPGNEEIVIGAVAEGGVVVWEEDVCKRLGVPLEYRQEIVKVKVNELERKEDFFRENKPLPDIKDKTIVIVDDGVATGSTIKAAIDVVRSFSPKEVIVAVPIIAREVLGEIKQKADKVIFLETPELFLSLSQFYQDFRVWTDEEIKKIL